MNKIQSLFSPSQEEEFETGQILSIMGLAALTAILISVVPIVKILNYPFRLFFTIVHELGHGVAAMLTGGDFQNFIISADGSGLAYSIGGWRFVIIPAGYLGVAIFCAVLILVGRSHRWSRITLGLVGGLMILLTLYYGRPGAMSINAIVNSVLTLVMGVLFGALLLRIAFKASAGMVLFFIYLFAIKGGFTALTDIIGLIGLSGQNIHTDAHSMAELTHLPTILWAVVWVIMAFFIIGGAVWAAWFVSD